MTNKKCSSWSSCCFSTPQSPSSSPPRQTSHSAATQLSADEEIELDRCLEKVATLINNKLSEIKGTKSKDGLKEGQETKFSWDFLKMDSKGLNDLKEILNEGMSSAESLQKYIPEHGGKDATQAIIPILERIGSYHWITFSLLLVGKTLERWESVTENKEECLRLLEEMGGLALILKQIRDRKIQNQNMEALIKVAVERVFKGYLLCYHQMSSSRLRGFEKIYITILKKSSLFPKKKCSSWSSCCFATPQSPSSSPPRQTSHSAATQLSADEEIELDRCLEKVATLINNKLSEIKGTKSIDDLKEGEDTKFSWDFLKMDSKGLNDLKEILNEGMSSAESLQKYIPDHGGKDATQAIIPILERIGSYHWITFSLLLVGKTLERWESVTENKEECLRLLEEMGGLALILKQIRDRKIQNQNMEALIKVAVERVFKGYLLCCHQMSSSRLRGLFIAKYDKSCLSQLRLEIDETYKKIMSQMQICIYDAITCADKAPTSSINDIHPKHPDPPQDAKEHDFRSREAVMTYRMEFVTFKWKNNGKYLSLARKKMHGYWHLVFEDDSTVLPTLWEVILTGEEHLSSPVVRVRGRGDGSVWRKSPGSDYVLSAGDTKEYRNSLFALIKLDDDTVSLLCLGNNRYAKASNWDTYAPNALITDEETNASELCKFRVNKELPKYASFQWNDIGQYLSLGRKRMHGYWHLPFENTNEVTAWEVVPTYEKHQSAHVVRVRLPRNDASIWRKSTGSDWVLSAGAAEENRNSLFAWIKVDENTVSLLCLGNNCYLEVEKGSAYAPNALMAAENTNESDLCKFQVKDAVP